MHFGSLAYIFIPLACTLVGGYLQRLENKLDGLSKKLDNLTFVIDQLNSSQRTSLSNIWDRLHDIKFNK